MNLHELFELWQDVKTGQMLIFKNGHGPNGPGYQFLSFVSFTPLDEFGKEIRWDEAGLSL